MRSHPADYPWRMLIHNDLSWFKQVILMMEYVDKWKGVNIEQAKIKNPPGRYFWGTKPDADEQISSKIQVVGYLALCFFGHCHSLAINGT